MMNTGDLRLSLLTVQSQYVAALQTFQSMETKSFISVNSLQKKNACIETVCSAKSSFLDSLTSLHFLSNYSGQ